MTTGLKLTTTFLITCNLLLGTAYTSSQSGNMNANGTFGGGGSPGDGDTMTITDGTAVTCPISTTCIAGTSGGNDTTAILIGSSGTVSTAQLIINGHLITRGDIISNGAVQVPKTVGYCPVMMNPGSILEFDASHATNPMSVNYYFSGSALFNADAIVCAAGTANSGDLLKATTGGNHVTIMSTAGGGNGYFNYQLYSGWAYSFAYTDFINMGDTSHPMLTTYGFGTQVLTLTMDHVTLTGCSGINLLAPTAGQGYSLTHTVFKKTQGYYCITWGGYPAIAAGASRTMDNFVCDVSVTNIFLPNSWIDVTFTHSFTIFPLFPATSERWAAFDDNIVVYNNFIDPNGTGVSEQGDDHRNYFHFYLDLTHQHGRRTDFNLPFTSYDGIYDNASTIGPCGSDMVINTSTGSPAPTDLMVRMIILPPAKVGCSPGGALHTSDYPNLLGMDHGTVFAQEGVNMGDNGGTMQQLSQATNSIFYVPPGYSITSYDSYKAVELVPTTCFQDYGPPSMFDYNVGWNIRDLDPRGIACWTNQGKGYHAKWSVTPGAHDLADQNPQFTDITRNLQSYDTAGLGHTLSPAWSSSTSYNEGDKVSITDSGYYNGTPINFTCIKAYTAGAQYSRPGYMPSNVSGSNWRDYWEPDTFQDIRDGLYSGQLFNGNNIIVDLQNWVRAGLAPNNPNLKNAANDGTTLGAVPFNGRVPHRILQ